MARRYAVSKGGGVGSVTNLGRSGVYDWIIQRFTAVVLLAYVAVLVAFFAKMGTAELTYSQWAAFMTHPVMQLFNTFALLCVLGHAWVGLWTITTDYCKPVAFRFALQVVFFLFIFMYLVWGLKVFWGL